MLYYTHKAKKNAKKVNGIKPQSKLWTQNTDSSLQASCRVLR